MEERLKESKIFEAFAHMYESFSSAKPPPIDYSKYGCTIDGGGRGNPDYPLTVVCHFHGAVGKDDWHNFIEYYMPTRKHPEAWLRSVSQKVRRFWERVDNSKFELERLAAFYYMQRG